MKIAVIGAGNVGTVLGETLRKRGHSITYGVRDPEKAQAKTPGARRIAEAVAASELAILATPFEGARAAVEAAGDFAGKVLIDLTNPIGPGFVLAHAHTTSGAEELARVAKNARVVKAFNTTGVENMADPKLGNRSAAMWIAGDDEAALAIV